MRPYISSALVVWGASYVLSHGPVPTRVGPTHTLRGSFDAMAGAAKSKLSDSIPIQYEVDDSSSTKNKETTSPSAFGTTLFSEVCSHFPTGNVLISPLSIYKALALVKDGATIDSENEAEMERVLGPPFLVQQTDGDPDVQLTIASSVWAEKVKQSYIDMAVERHDADAFNLPKRYTAVDKWIENKTNGMIKGFLGDDPVEWDVVALLVNAVYFKGTWTYEFNQTETIDGDFTLSDGTTLAARYMTAKRKMGYISELPSLGGASAVVLDYGKKKSDDAPPTEFTSLFILPASSEDAMNNVVEGLKSQPLSDLLNQARQTEVNLRLPRFKLAFGADEPAKLKPVLESMGMKIAFDPSSATDGKFDQMSYDPSVYLDEVFHGAVMEVTEAGTEAAAATVAKMKRRSLPRPPPDMFFDQPFVVAIIHRPTGEPVFIGRVEVPHLDF